MNLLFKARHALNPGGRFVVVDEFDRPGVDPSLLLLAHAFCASLDNPDCSAPKTPELYALLSEAGFQSARAGRQPNGMPLIGAERWVMIRVLPLDAYLEGASCGNVAGAVVDACGLSYAETQRIASELNAPTTGFVADYQDGYTPAFAIRFFTPCPEVYHCGHVAVATFTALVEEDRCKSQDESTRVLQRTPAGELLLDLWSAEENGVNVDMQQRLPSIERPSLETNVFRRALGDLALDSRLPLEIASTGLRHLVVPYAFRRPSTSRP